MKRWIIASIILIGAIASGVYFTIQSKVSRAPTVMLIGFDGASWNLMNPLLKDRQLPNFQRVIQNGTTAALTTLTPTWSPLLWTSIATGKLPEKHGIRAYRDNQTGVINIAQGNSRITKTFWNILSDSGIRVGVVNWWVTWPAEKINGYIVSDKYRRTRSRNQLTYPPNLINELPRVGLTPQAFENDKKRYGLSESIEKRIAIRENTEINYKVYWGQDKAIYEASRLLLKKQNVQVFAVIFRIIDVSSHVFWTMLQSGSRNDENYSRILKPIYIYADEILGDLLKHADRHTNVIICSDHGFQLINGIYDHNLKKDPPNGILILSGPRFRKTYNLQNASILDITPTVLHVLNLPVGKDMDGRVLVNSLSDQSGPGIQYIATYDVNAVPQKAPAVELDEQTKDDFRALGYIQ
jgi:predicted AlkP superfamily phosphohydrolase/phosphomutase